jgi:hypothetical protein
MSQSGTVRIQAQAVRALAQWKAIFADEVSAKAKELAGESDPPGLVTLEHYREAARLAVQTLAKTVESQGESDGRREAA